MGVDLQWLVLGGSSRDHNYSPTMIEAGRDYEFHDLLRKIKTYDPPTNVGCYIADSKDDDYKYGDLPDADPYGDPYRMVKAGDIAAIEYEADYATLMAALAYVRALRPETWIVLHWH